MCTAITLHTKDHYFGRNLDYETTFGEQVVLTPRCYELRYKCLPAQLPDRNNGQMKNHFAMLGMAVVAEDYPLYFDAFNEKGLAMAGLHFVGNAYYEKPGNEEVSYEKSSMKKKNIAPYELIPWVLSQCENVSQVKELLAKTHVVAVSFNKKFPLSPLHFMIADKKGHAIVAEPVKEGLKIYDNPVGVLTNNPPFPYHLENLNNYLNLTAEPPVNRFSPELTLKPYSRGMGGIGLPGDVSSASRFVRAAFVRANSVCGESEQESVNQFFHILGNVEQVRGCAHLENGCYEITTYSACCNQDKGIYYYRTYEDFTVRSVHMQKQNLNGSKCITLEC